VLSSFAAMQRLPHHFLTMAFNNAWANRRLLAAVSQLSQEDFVATRTGFFPSLKGTLNHTLTVDWYYVGALERSLAGREVDTDAHRRCFDPEEPMVTAAELSEAQHAVDRRLLEVCRGLTDERLDTIVAIQRSTGIAHDRADRMLAHLFEHQIHHRGQAHAMLSSTSVAPPQLDEFFCAGDASLRAKEFAELGFSEEEIWSRR